MTCVKNFISRSNYQKNLDKKFLMIPLYITFNFLSFNVKKKKKYHHN